MTQAIKTSTKLGGDSGLLTSSPIYQVATIFHHPLADYLETALKRWKKGVLCVREDPTPTYLKKFGIVSGPWTFHGWGEWYRLLEADGSEYLDYFILADSEVEVYSNAN